jgi:hypothetical protein
MGRRIVHIVHLQRTIRLAPLTVHWQRSIVAGAREEVWEQQQLNKKVGEASTTRGRGWGGSITSEQ